jgi:mannosyltransferase
MAADTAHDAVTTSDESPSPVVRPADDSPVPEPARASWLRPMGATLALMAGPFVVTLTVMLVRIGERQLWRDEDATWWAASLPLADLRKLVETVDVVLLPYYVLMHGWMAVFGDSAAAMRVPSALFMAVAAALIALIGRRLFDAPTGLIAGLLVPAIPVVSRYGQEARPYAMAMLASVTAVLLLLRALERPTVWRWLAYTLAVVWIAASHIVALMALAAHLIAVLAALRTRPEPATTHPAAVRAKMTATTHPAGPTADDAETTATDPPAGPAADDAGTSATAPPARREISGRRLRILIGWPAALVLAMLTVSPLIVIGQRQGGQISWIPDPVWARVQAFPGEVFMSDPVAGFLVALGLAAILALAFAGREIRWTAGFLALWTLLPPVLAYYTFHKFHFFFPRYLLFTVPAWVLLAAYAVRRFAAGATGRVWVPVLATTLAAGAGLAYVGWDQQELVRSDAVENEFAYRQAAAFIRAREQPGDGIIFTGYRYVHRGFRYQWRDQPRTDQPREILVDLPADRSWSWVHPPCADTVACLGDTERIWLVSTDPSGQPLSPLPGTQQPAVQQRYDVAEQTHFHRIWVSELVRKPTT